MHLGAIGMPNDPTREQVASHTSGGIVEERGLAKGQIALMDRRSLSAYSFSSREYQGASTDAEDNAPGGGGDNNIEIG